MTLITAPNVIRYDFYVIQLPKVRKLQLVNPCDPDVDQYTNRKLTILPFDWCHCLCFLIARSKVAENGRSVFWQVSSAHFWRPKSRPVSGYFQATCACRLPDWPRQRPRQHHCQRFVWNFGLVWLIISFFYAAFTHGIDPPMNHYLRKLSKASRVLDV